MYSIIASIVPTVKLVNTLIFDIRSYAGRSKDPYVGVIAAVRVSPYLFEASPSVESALASVISYESRGLPLIDFCLDFYVRCPVVWLASEGLFTAISGYKGITGILHNLIVGSYSYKKLLYSGSILNPIEGIKSLIYL